jgi:hypothetical protein
MALTLAACITGPAPETGSASDPSPAAAQLGDPWWFSIDMGRAGTQREGGAELVRGFRLQIGSFAGQILSEVNHDFPIEEATADFTAAEPFAEAAGRDRLVYGFFDGQTSEVRVLSVSTGLDASVYETSDVVHFGVLDIKRQAMYVVLLEHESRRDLGVWRLSIAEPHAEPALFLPPADGDPRRTGWFERLWLANDGALLVVRDCSAEGCRIRVADTATGDMVSSGETPGSGLEVYGVTEEVLYFDGNCNRPCPLSAYSLSTGIVERLGNLCTTATVTEGEGGPLLLYEVSVPQLCREQRDRYEVAAHDIRTRREWSAYISASGDLGLVPQAHGSSGFTAPEGWLLIGRDSSFLGQRTVMVRAVDGETVELPRFGH